MDLKIIYEDANILVIDKPSGIVVFPERPGKEKTLIDYLLEKFPSLKNVGESPRYGIVHRLDKGTSGILLVAKNNESLRLLQKEFQERMVQKEYLALVVGDLKPKKGTIKTLIGRDPKNGKRQKAFALTAPEVKKKGIREAITEYKVVKKIKDYTLVTANPKTGRKHQIRCHFLYLGHPIAGDKLYNFRRQPGPENLTRHFLHASYLKIRLPDGKEKEFKSELPKDLKKVLEKLKVQS